MTETRGKTYLIEFPDTHTEKVQNLKQFCREKGLDFASLARVARGERKSHKAYKATIVDHGNEVVGKNQITENG